MPTLFRSVKSYKLTLYKQHKTDNIPFDHFIRLEGSKDEKVYIYFVKPGFEDESNTVHESFDFAKIFVEESQYPDFVDLLRNEKPVYMYLNNTNPNLFYITTSDEPVGEEES